MGAPALELPEDAHVDKIISRYMPGMNNSLTPQQELLTRCCARLMQHIQVNETYFKAVEDPDISEIRQQCRLVSQYFNMLKLLDAHSANSEKPVMSDEDFKRYQTILDKHRA